jgi:hypothetical protein
VDAECAAYELARSILRLQRDRDCARRIAAQSKAVPDMIGK